MTPPLQSTPAFGAVALHRRVALLLMSAGWGANHFTAMLIVYRRLLGLSSASLGLLFGAYALGLVPGLILAGRVSDRLGRRIVLPTAWVAIAASLLLAFGQHGFGVLLAGRLSYGLAMGCVMGPGSVWVQELSEPGSGPRRATLALSLGFGLGPLISGAVAEFLPWPLVLPYLVHAVLMTLAVAAARQVPDTARRVAPLATPAPMGSSPRTRHALGAPELNVLARQLPIAPWAFGLPAVAMVVLPAILRPNVTRPVLYSASLAATTLFAGVLVQPLTTQLVRGAELVGASLGTVGILLGARAVALVAPGFAFIAALFLGAGYGLIMTSGLRDVSRAAPSETRGTVVGTFYVLTYLGFALPFLHALAAKHYGDVQTLQFSALLVVLSAVVRACTRAGVEHR